MPCQSERLPVSEENDTTSSSSSSFWLWATSPLSSSSAAAATSASATVSLPSSLVFLPEFTEHPKPKRRNTFDQLHHQQQQALPPGSDDDEVTFLQDFIAGGMAGSASVVVGHPLDTIKVRFQNSSSNASIRATIQEFGGFLSLFRGMTAPLGTAALVNALVFSSYGVGSTYFDTYICHPSQLQNMYSTAIAHDPWPKSMLCGSFAGLIQCLVICPMEHVKCRMQMQTSSTKGPLDMTRKIVSEHGMQHGLYRGWWATFWREVPAFGAYFAIYDHVKDVANSYFAKQAGITTTTLGSSNITHTHTWLASTLAGGLAGSITWGFIYPIDVIKTHIQTSKFSQQVSIFGVARKIIQTHGWKHLFRGITITLVRAFPVNGTIFPVYEFTLMHIKDSRK